MKNGNISKLVARIIGMTLFIILTTIFIYIPKNNELAASLAFLDIHENFYIDNTNINLEKNYPVSDRVGLTTTSNTFKVVNNTNEDRCYKLVLQTGNGNESNNVVDNEVIHYVIKVNDGEYSDVNTLNSEGVIFTDKVLGNTKNTYEIKLWINTDDNSKVQNKIFQGIIKLAE